MFDLVKVSKTYVSKKDNQEHTCYNFYLVDKAGGRLTKRLNGLDVLLAPTPKEALDMRVVAVAHEVVVNVMKSKEII